MQVGVKLLGMDMAVGKKPSAMPMSTLQQLNGIFLELVEQAIKSPAVELSSFESSKWDSKGVERHGWFTLHHAKNWLAHYGLASIQGVQRRRDTRWT